MKLSSRVLVNYEEIARARSSRTERLRGAIRRSLRAISAKAILGVRLVGRNHSYSMRARIVGRSYPTSSPLAHAFNFFKKLGAFGSTILIVTAPK